MWQVKTDRPIFSSPVLYECMGGTGDKDKQQYVVFGSHDCHLRCVCSGTGALIWAVQCGAVLFSSPAVLHRHSYIRSQEEVYTRHWSNNSLCPRTSKKPLSSICVTTTAGEVLIVKVDVTVEGSGRESNGAGEESNGAGEESNGAGEESNGAGEESNGAGTGVRFMAGFASSVMSARVSSKFRLSGEIYSSPVIMYELNSNVSGGPNCGSEWTDQFSVFFGCRNDCMTRIDY